MGGDSQVSTEQKSGDSTYDMMQTYIGFEQMDMSKEMWNWAKQQYNEANEYFRPFEKDLTNANRALIPLQTDAEAGLLQSTLKDLAMGDESKTALHEQQMKEISMSAPVAEKFYLEALKGIDPDYEKVTGQAAADVEQSYTSSMDTTRRELARMGLSPTSGAMASAMTDLTRSKAADKAYAMTAAREAEKQRVEDSNWERLKTGMTARGSATGIAGTINLSGSGQNAVQAVQAGNPYSYASGYAGQSASSLASASNTFGSLSDRNSSTTTTQSGGDSGAGSAIGAGLGLATSMIGLV
ncbi:hypothetical protein [Desulfovibrio inopinatus]|uniref:hypothetical protein n=1 Tax=Desulfovibrio inopinatus TaxID=102109 RepID=UPI000407152C|nr:hypothetical protein [Desulfovibrio inopinatus]